MSTTSTLAAAATALDDLLSGRAPRATKRTKKTKTTTTSTAIVAPTKNDDIEAAARRVKNSSKIGLKEKEARERVRDYYTWDTGAWADLRLNRSWRCARRRRGRGRRGRRGRWWMRIVIVISRRDRVLAFMVEILSIMDGVLFGFNAGMRVGA